MRSALLFLLLLFFVGAPSAAQSNEDAAHQLSGMWRLVSNPQRLADGTTRQGANGVSQTGYAFFNASGTHMCFVTGTNSYCATLEIHAKEGFMDRHYDVNSNASQVGRATRRWFSFQGLDRLTLRVDDAELTKPVVETLFIWERVKD